MNRRVDLGDTSRCPLGVRCESCGAETPDLDVLVVPLHLSGVACMTLCRRCAGARVSPPVTVATADRLVGQHCGHLGITRADMAAALQKLGGWTW